MALITCKNCGRPVSDKAPACPHCGAEIEPAATQARPEPGAEFVPDAEDSVKPTISPVVAIIAIAIIAIGAMAGYYLYQQEMERQRAEFVRDSLAQVERARIAAEKARQDSIRRVHETIVNGYLEALRIETNNWERDYPEELTLGSEVYYLLFDMDHSGIPILWMVKLGGTSLNYEYVAYAYVDDKVQRIYRQGSGISYGSLYIGDDYLLVFWTGYPSDLNVSALCKYTYRNGKIHEDVLSSSNHGYDWPTLTEPEAPVIISSYKQPIINMFK